MAIQYADELQYTRTKYDLEKSERYIQSVFSSEPALHDGRAPSSGETAAWRQPIAKALAQRIIRQGLKTNISDKNRESRLDQSKSGNKMFLGENFIAQKIH